DLTASFSDDALLAKVEASALLDPAALLDPERRPTALLTTPVAGHVAVGRRKIEAFRSLPSFVRDKVPVLAGETAIDAYVAGTFMRPTAVVRVRGWDVAPAPAAFGIENPWALPVDFDVAASYDGTLAALDAHVAHGGREVGGAEARLTVPLEKLKSADSPMGAVPG